MAQPGEFRDISLMRLSLDATVKAVEKGKISQACMTLVPPLLRQKIWKHLIEARSKEDPPNPSVETCVTTWAC